MSQGPICLEHAHELWFLLFPCFSNSCSQLSPPAWVVLRKSRVFRPWPCHIICTLVIFLDLLSWWLYFFPCLVFLSPFSHAYPLHCSAATGCSESSNLLLLDALDGSTAQNHGKGYTVVLGYQHGVIWTQTRLCGAGHRRNYPFLPPKKAQWMQPEGGQNVMIF